MRETGPDTYELMWKVPARGSDERLGIYVNLPADCRQLTEPRGSFVGGAFVERCRFAREGGLAGQTVTIAGLPATSIDVLVRFQRADGSVQTSRLVPSNNSFVVQAASTAGQVAWTYVGLGVEHILLGIDHLLYILAMLLLVKGWRRVVGVMTAFTLTHSLTLTAAALGWVHVPQAPVEACIALSILFVACEIVRSRQGHAGLTARWPWVVSFAFGLLHGFGFAGALSEVGLPDRAIPVALLFFNLGVELGQVMFILAVLFIIGAGTRLARRFQVREVEWAWRVPPYAIGSVTAFWLIQRVAAFS